MGKGSVLSICKAHLELPFPLPTPPYWAETICGITHSSTAFFAGVGPEVELNSTFFQDGKNDGRKQNFATPGLVLGRFPLWGRVGFTVGAGYQIATTHFHASNHKAILSIRFPF
jgi:hypothetical protein